MSDTPIWIKTSDEFGYSYRCSVCGHNEFYKDEEPTNCEHTPPSWEADMQSDRSTA